MTVPSCVIPTCGRRTKHALLCARHRRDYTLCKICHEPYRPARGKRGYCLLCVEAARASERFKGHPTMLPREVIEKRIQKFQELAELSLPLF